MSMSQFNIDALGAQIARSATPTSSAQVAEGLNLEAERAAFEAWHRSKFETKYSTGQPTRDMHNGIYAENYGPKDQQLMWEVWQAARTAAPVAEGVALPPLDTEGLPPLPEAEYPTIDNEAALYTAEQVRQAQRDAIAPYAERIRQLERELAEDRVVHKSVEVGAKAAETRMDASSEGGAQTIDTPEFRVLLDIYRDADGSQSKSARAALIAYIDGRTAGPAVPDWQPIETAPQDKMLLLAAEFDGPGDWRIKVGGFWDRKWNVFGATWTPTRWMPLPAAPKPQEDA